MSIFSSVKKRKLKYNQFNLSHEVKLSHNIGQLIPVYVQPDVLPGDRFKVNTECLVKFAPLIAPMYQRIDTYVHYFFVPYRLLDYNFKKNICNIDPNSMANVCDTYTFPEGIKQGTIFDYLGYPVTIDSNDKKIVETHSLAKTYFNCFALRAYLAIYMSYYRDENLMPLENFDSGILSELKRMPIFADEFPISNISPHNENMTTSAKTLKPLYRCWKKDYFTSALPRPQSSELGASVPIGTITGNINYRTGLLDGSEKEVVYKPTSGGNGELWAKDSSNSEMINSNINIDTSKGSISINDLRRSNALQRFLENNARGGKRYIEQLLSHFGVVSSDARLQRPQYLGGGRIGVSVSEVVQQSQTTDTSPLGDYAGHAVSVGSTPSFTYKSEEHGVILGIMSVMPQPSYLNPVNRLLTKVKPLDFAFPEFANLGEQEIYQNELDVSGEPSKVFGYTSRYAEYKYTPSRVAGEMRTTEKHWHMARDISNSKNVNLNSQFVTCNPSFDGLNRVFAIDDPLKLGVDTLYTEVYNSVQRSSKLPYYGVPIL